MVPGGEVDSFLWCLCVAHAGYATGSILHMLSILVHGSGEESRRTRTWSSLTPKYPQPPQVAGSLTTRTLRSPGDSPSTPSCYPLRRRRHWIWGTLRFDNLEQRIEEQWHAQGIWDWRDRAHSISYRELKAIRKLLMGHLGHQFEQESIQSLLLHVSNQAVVHITNALVSASFPMMRELRKPKLFLDRPGLQIRSEWIPSVANRFADGLSRRIPSGDLRIRRQLRHSAVAGMKALIDVFKHRHLGDPPVFRRRQSFHEL